MAVNPDPLALYLLLFAAIQSAIFALQAWIGYKQTRPYLFIEDANIRQTGEGWKIVYVIKNNGTSPAHRVETLDVATVVDWEPTGPLPTPNDKDNLGSIGPGGDNVEMEPKSVYSKIEIRNAIAESTKAILLRGRVTYLDGFHRKHWTDYCFYSTGFIEMNGDRMKAWSEGNDST